MTTNVIVNAHPIPGHDVRVNISDSAGAVTTARIMKNGETEDFVIYDDLTITVAEVKNDG